MSLLPPLLRCRSRLFSEIAAVKVGVVGVGPSLDKRKSIPPRWRPPFVLSRSHGQAAETVSDAVGIPSGRWDTTDVATALDTALTTSRRPSFSQPA